MNTTPKKITTIKIIRIVFWTFIVLCLIGYLLEDNSYTQSGTEEETYSQASLQNNLESNSQVIESINTPIVDYKRGSFTREFKWNYGENNYGITLTLYPEVYNVFKERVRTRDYDLFASDSYSKPFIKMMTEDLRDYGKENNLTEEEIPYFIISFIQSLPYTSDKVTTSFDEYPRFPYETFYDNGGDCEDTSILASAMLKELGYGVAMLEFPSHMAVGVKCVPSEGQSYYVYQKVDFCYLETTGENWDVGQIPDEYKNSKATIIPIIEKPSLEIHFVSDYSYNSRDVYSNVNVTIRNLGSETAKSTRVYVALQTEDESKVWSDTMSESLEILPEESYKYTVTNLHSPTGQPFRIYVRASGDNVLSDESYSTWIYWK